MKRHYGWLVMEFLDFPTLAEVMLENEADIKNVMIQLLNTLSYLHRENIVHRDVKPENILYDPLTKKIKLIDFGIAKPFVRRSIFVDLLTQTGTLYYRAPEMFNFGGYREGVDVWAAGITLFKLFTGITPF
jgi:calcium-dependent protein kinase